MIASLQELRMATLPGAPHHENDPEHSTLPVEPEFAPVMPEEPSEGEHEPVPKPGEMKRAPAKL
jgi:hypothetical protein